MDRRQESILYAYVRKRFPSSYDLLDFHSLIDRTLSYQENKEFILERYALIDSDSETYSSLVDNVEYDLSVFQQNDLFLVEFGNSKNPTTRTSKDNYSRLNSGVLLEEGEYVSDINKVNHLLKSKYDYKKFIKNEAHQSVTYQFKRGKITIQKTIAGHQVIKNSSPHRVSKYFMSRRTFKAMKQPKGNIEIRYCEVGQ